MLTIITYVFFCNSCTYAVIEDIENHWCENEIKSMYESGYIDLKEENKFAPDEQLTKAEFCATVNRILKYSESNSATLDWEKEFAIGIEKGYMPIGSADDTITREEACVIFERITDITIDNTLEFAKYESFTDYKNVSIWAEKAVKRMVINGKIVGYTDNTLKMKNKLTRAEFVMIMSRFDETAKQLESARVNKKIPLNAITILDALNTI